jgi:hypothetical protein
MMAAYKAQNLQQLEELMMKTDMGMATLPMYYCTTATATG